MNCKLFRFGSIVISFKHLVAALGTWLCRTWPPRRTITKHVSTFECCPRSPKKLKLVLISDLNIFKSTTTGRSLIFYEQLNINKLTLGERSPCKRKVISIRWSCLMILVLMRNSIVLNCQTLITFMIEKWFIHITWFF